MLALHVSDTQYVVFGFGNGYRVERGPSLPQGCARFGQDSRARTKDVIAECRQRERHRNASEGKKSCSTGNQMEMRR